MTPATPVALVATSATDPAAILARLQRGVVSLEVSKRRVGVGVVLDGDGRILSSLSLVGRGVGVTVRYPDGTVQKLKVSYSDRAWDLVLLSPADTRYLTGLRASASSLEDATSLRTSRGAATALRLQGLPAPHRETLTGGDGVTLEPTFTFGSVIGETGAPVIDSSGDVVGLFATACASNAQTDCRVTTFAVPTGVLKRFLREVPTNSPRPLPWLGLSVVPLSTASVAGGPGVRISAIQPGSPAALLGLKSSSDPTLADVLLAIDGIQVSRPEHLEELLSRRTGGERVRLLVSGQGRVREVTAVLGVAPQLPLTRRTGSRADLGY